MVGLGYGEFVDLMFVLMLDFLFSGDLIDWVCLYDINGDGLLDLVIERVVFN